MKRNGALPTLIDDDRLLTEGVHGVLCMVSMGQYDEASVGVITCDDRRGYHFQWCFLTEFKILIGFKRGEVYVTCFEGFCECRAAAISGRNRLAVV